MGRRPARWICLLAVGLGVAGFARLARAGDEEEAGRALYRKYCGACHGPSGRGDGIAGVLFNPKAADLTQLAKKAGGQFPYQRTLRYIDGRESVHAHGDPDMPVWGEVFRQESSWSIEHSAEIRGKLMLITDYVQSIQAK
jgi:mono/diheme cytochrome c family protein